MRKYLFPLLLVIVSFNLYGFVDVSSTANLSHQFGSGFFYFGGGAAVLDYNNDGNEDVYLSGGLNPDKLYRNNGDGTFTDQALVAGFSHNATYRTVGVSAADINNDGHDDLFITTWCSITDMDFNLPNLIYLNNGNGTFTDITGLSGIIGDTAMSSSAVFADYNMDGWLDIYVSNYIKEPFFSYSDSSGNLDAWNLSFSGKENILYINNKDLSFTAMNQYNEFEDNGCGFIGVMVDIDGDTDPDIYGLNDFGNSLQPNQLLLNNFPEMGANDVSQVSNADLGMYSMGVSVGDYDENGQMDFYVTNLGDNVLLKNNGNAVFNDEANSAGVKSGFVNFQSVFTTTSYFASRIGNDYYSCIRFDSLNQVIDTSHFIISVWSSGGVQEWSMNDTFIVYMGLGKTYSYTFAERDHFGQPSSVSFLTTASKGIASLSNEKETPLVGWGSNFLDFDNDSYLDLFVCNGGLNPHKHDEVVPNPNALYKNDGNGAFTDVSVLNGIGNMHSTKGSVTFDYDNDGDLDILAVNQGYPEEYAAGMNPNVLLLENDQSTNMHWLRLKLHGIETNRNGIGARIEAHFNNRTLIRQVLGGSSIHSSSSKIVHFGLGNSTTVDSVIIIWPRGRRQKLNSLNTDTFLLVIEDTSIEMNCYYPGSFGLNAVNHERATLKWDYHSSANKYVLEVKQAGQANWHRISITEPSNNKYSLYNLESAKLYKARIKSVCKSSKSDYSPVLSFTTDCVSPESIRVSNITGTTALLEWDPVKMVEGYELIGRKKGTNPATPKSFLIAGKENTSKLLTGLKPFKTYQWKLKSVCDYSNNITSVKSGLLEFTTLPLRVFDNSDQLTQATEIEFYPIPFSDILYYNLGLEVESVTIYDLKGALVYQFDEKDMNMGHLNLSFVKSGVYIFESLGSEITRTKIIKY